MAFGYEAGQRAVAEDLAGAGLTVVKSWLTVGDDNVDPDCEENEAAGEVGVDDDFPSGDREPPAHPYCRCTTEYRVLTSDELGQPLVVPEDAPDVRDAPFVRSGPERWDADGSIRGLMSNGEVRPIDSGDMASLGIPEGLSGVPTATRQTIRSTLAELARDYPGVMRHMRAIGYNPAMDDGTYAWAFKRGVKEYDDLKTYMEVGPRFQQPRKLISSLKADSTPPSAYTQRITGESLPWHPVTSAKEAIKSVIDHEFGHVLNYTYLDEVERFVGTTLPQRLRERAIAAGGTADDVASSVNSAYGRKNAMEQFAELFAEARSRVAYKNLTPAGQVMREWLEEQTRAGLFAT
jgi:hypothetical protein